MLQWKLEKLYLLFTEKKVVYLFFQVIIYYQNQNTIIVHYDIRQNCRNFTIIFLWKKKNWKKLHKKSRKYEFNFNFFLNWSKNEICKKVAFMRLCLLKVAHKSCVNVKVLIKYKQLQVAVIVPIKVKMWFLVLGLVERKSVCEQKLHVLHYQWHNGLTTVQFFFAFSLAPADSKTVQLQQQLRLLITF